MARFGLWNSRGQLLALASFILAIIFLFDFVFPSHDQELRDEEDVSRDMDYVIDAMDYLQETRNGTAIILPVVEEEKGVNEFYWSCSLAGMRGRQEVIRNEKDTEEAERRAHKWTHTDIFHSFSAYFDHRPNSLYPENRAVQVLAMSYRFPSAKVYCNILKDSRQMVVEGYVREIWQRAWDPRGNFMVPLLITCPLPQIANEGEMYIQITTLFCYRHEDYLPVTIPSLNYPKAIVAVCVKGMDFEEDISASLVEWIEAQLLFGADIISIYVYSVPVNVERILRMYEKDGKIELVFLDLPGDHSPHIPIVRSDYIRRNRQEKRRYELIPYNDCFYRHLNSHEFVLVVDTDEIVVPLIHNDWIQLLQEVQNNTRDRLVSSISLRNVFKFPYNNEESEKEKKILPFLTNKRRSRRTSKRGDYGKSFSSTRNVATLFNHFSLHRLSSAVSPTLHLPEDFAIKLHYKDSCPIESQHECSDLMRDTVEDSSLERFFNELKGRVLEARKRIGL